MNARVPDAAIEQDPAATETVVDVEAVLDATALVAVLHIAQRAQAATSAAELGFTMVNETLSLVDYRQAAFFDFPDGETPHLATASGLASVAGDAPFTVWLTRLAATFPRGGGCHRVQVSDVPQADSALADGWREWLPDHVLVAPLADREGRVLGLLMYAREEPWDAVDVALVGAAQRHYAYSLWALGRHRLDLRARVAKAVKARWLRWGVPAALLALLIPVRLTALAPAEVVALNAMAIAAPQEGIVARFHVQPNATVRAGDLLFSLDDTTLKSKRDVAVKALSIARADLLVAQQRSFDDLKSKGELASAQGRVHEKESELALTDTALARIDVHAERNGVAIFSDANDWIGKPVQTGERVMQLADPNDAGVLVWLPASDALNLEPGAPVRLFLHTQPLHPLSAQLLQTSYQAVQSPDGVAAYRLRGGFEPTREPAPRIGLRGTARVSGGWAILGYYVFRRPISALREWTGL